jgi:hypothetical protein
MTSRTATRCSLVPNTVTTRVTMTAVLAAAMVVTSVGCGHQTSPAAPTPLIPPSSSPAPSTNTVPAANNGEVGVYRVDVTMPRSGTATITLSWPNADFSLQLFVTSGVCADTAMLMTGGCTVLGSTRPGSLPGLVTSPVIGGDLNTIWVLNSDPFPQSFTVNVDVE